MQGRWAGMAQGRRAGDGARTAGRDGASLAGRTTGDRSRAVRLRRGIFLGKQGEMLAGAGSAITRIRARYRLKRPSVAFFPYFPDCFSEKSPLLHSTARERSPAARPSVAATPAGWFFALALTVEDFRAYIGRESYGLVERYRADGLRTGDTGCA